MSAQYGAPRLGRPQIATPAYSTAPQGSVTFTGSRSAAGHATGDGGLPPPRSAPPVMAAGALAAIGAAGGGGHPEMGSLPGTQGPPGNDGSRPPTPAAPTASGQGDQKWLRKGCGLPRAARVIRPGPRRRSNSTRRRGEGHPGAPRTSRRRRRWPKPPSKKSRAEPAENRRRRPRTTRRDRARPTTAGSTGGTDPSSGQSKPGQRLRRRWLEAGPGQQSAPRHRRGMGGGRPPVTLTGVVPPHDGDAWDGRPEGRPFALPQDTATRLRAVIRAVRHSLAAGAHPRSFEQTTQIAVEAPSKAAPPLTGRRRARPSGPLPTRRPRRSFARRRRSSLQPRPRGATRRAGASGGRG